MLAYSGFRFAVYVQVIVLEDDRPLRRFTGERESPSRRAC